MLRRARRPSPAQRRRSHLVAADSNSPASESYRALRTALAASTNEGALPPTILVTSPRSEEGKSITCANLASLCAAAGHRVAILDADLRMPSQAHIWGVRGEGYPAWLKRGESSVLGSSIQIGDGMALFAPDAPVARPAELLQSPSFEHALHELRAAFDVVIVDSPPVTAVTDAALLAGMVDTVVLVLDQSRHNLRATRRAIRALQRVDAPLAGIVLNRVARAGRTATYGGYGARVD